MTKQVINTGTSPNDGTGDPARTAFAKANSNFDELYTAIGNGVVPLTQKGAANGVAALSGRSELSNRLLAAGLASGPAVMSTDGSSGSQFRVTYSHAAVVRANDGSANPAFLTYYPTAVANANGMYALEFIGYAHSGVASLIRFGLSFFYQSSSSTFSNVNLTHFGVRRPTVRLGVNADSRPVVIVATDSVGWTHAVLDSALMSHSNATDDYIRSWTGGSATDLTAFTNVVVAPDLGPLSRSGDTMTGPLQVPIGSASAASLAIGATSTGLYSGNLGGDITMTVATSPTLRALPTQVRVTQLGMGSSVGAIPDVTFTRASGGQLQVSTSGGILFSPNSNFQAVWSSNEQQLNYASESNNPAGLSIRRSRGSLAAPTALSSGDRVGILNLSAYNGAAYSNDFSLEASVLVPYTTSTDGGMGVYLTKRAAGAASRTQVIGISADNSVSISPIVGIGGVSTVGKTLRVYGDTQIDGRTFLGPYTQATLPTASSSTGCIAWCSNAAGGAAEVQCDGTEWISLKTGLPVNLAPYEAGSFTTGSGGNWFARRYADGTLQCSIRFNLILNSTSIGTTIPLAAAPMSWPVTFTTLETLMTSYIGGWSTAYRFVCDNAEPSMSSTGNLYVINVLGTTSATNGKGYLQVTGRWKT